MSDQLEHDNDYDGNNDVDETSLFVHYFCLINS